jgi:hypothetical protein
MTPPHPTAPTCHFFPAIAAGDGFRPISLAHEHPGSIFADRRDVAVHASIPDSKPVTCWRALERMLCVTPFS